MAVPFISSLDITGAPSTGGQAINIFGSNFNAPFAKVFFDDVLADAIIVTSANTITCQVPPGLVPGAVVITVVNPTDEVSNGVTFYLSNTLSSPDFSTFNPFFNEFGKYVFYGDVIFAKAPVNADGGGGGGAFDPAVSYDGISEPAISGDWKFTANFKANSTGVVELQSLDDDVIVSAPAPGKSVSCQAENVALSALAEVNLISATNDVKIQNLASVATPNVLYYDTGSRLVTYGAAPSGGFDPTLSYDGISNPAISGNWVFNANFKAIGTGFIELFSVDNNVSVGALNDVILNSATNSVKIQNLASVATPNVLFYDTVSRLVSYGAAPGFNTASNYTVTGNWQFNGGFQVQDSVSSITVIENTLNELLLKANNTLTIESASSNVTTNFADIYAVNYLGGGLGRMEFNGTEFSVSVGGALEFSGGFFDINTGSSNLNTGSTNWTATDITFDVSTVTFSSFGGIIQVTGNPLFTVDSNVIQFPNIPTEVPVVATPTISLPVGWSYVIRDSAGNLATMS